MKYHITTLGCRVNQYETQAMDTMLTERGHFQVPLEEAGVHIINTCAVTAESSRKSRQAIRRAKQQNPGAIIAVCGCFSQLSPWDVLELDVDLVHGSGSRIRFVDELETLCSDRDAANYERRLRSHIDDPRERKVFEVLPAGSVAGRTRALLKIEDGCENFCSYCVIPIARGTVRSIALNEAVRRAVELESEGYRELTLTGIEISSYGKDLEDTSLIDLVEAIAGAAPGLRIRLGSLEPSHVTEEFADRLAAIGSGQICDHFHLSLQSGCDEILWLMRRQYSTERFAQSAEFLRRRFPNCGLTADLIVGFPGETEDQHAETLRFIERIGFSSMHIFPYSPRPGTPAADLDGRHERVVLQKRASEAKDTASRLQNAFLERNIDETLTVLFETETDGICTGHAGNFTRVSVEGNGLRGTLRDVKIAEVRDGLLYGNI